MYATAYQLLLNQVGEWVNDKNPVGALQAVQSKEDRKASGVIFVFKQLTETLRMFKNILPIT